MPHGMSRVELWRRASAEDHFAFLDNDLDVLEASVDDRFEGLQKTIAKRLDVIDARSKLMLTTFITLLVAVIGAISVLLLTR